jgi:predicted DsbA family dithiol-disulfide isomerase
VPLPAVGLLCEVGLLVVALRVRDAASSFVVAAAAACGGVIATLLLAVQGLVIGAFCRWCVLVDLCAIVAAGAALALHRAQRALARNGEETEALAKLARRPALIAGWSAGAALVAVLPFVWAEYPVVAPLPPEVAKLAVPGKVTIVGFTDFECPFCRRLAPAQHEAVARFGDRVALVRKMAPLDSHPGAMPAALAYVCTPVDKREAMAMRLYGAPEASLTPEGVKPIAHELGLDAATFSACTESSNARATVDADKALFDGLELHGLPFTFVGSRTVLGGNPRALEKLVEQAMEGDRPSLPVAWMMALVAAVAAALGAFTLRVARVISRGTRGESAPTPAAG